MNPSEEGLSGGPLDDVNWREASDRMKRVIAANLKGSASAEQIEDLAQECCVKLMHVVLQGGVRSIEAMEVTIAKRAAIDWIRKRKVKQRRPNESAIGGSAGEEMLSRLANPKPEDPDLSPEELQFYVRELLHAITAKCRELYEHWLVTLNLRAVAERLGVSHAAARQRWVGCGRRVIEIMREDRGSLGGWAREAAKQR